MNELSGIVTPHENDVLSGRGKPVNSHPGNKRFRSYVRNQKELYNQAPKVEKPIFAKLIVITIRNLVPPGRFLKQDPSTGLWSDIGDRKALDKTRQALREKMSSDTTCPSPLHGVMTESLTQNILSSPVAMPPEMSLDSILYRQLQCQWAENIMINGMPQHSSTLPVGATALYQYNLFHNPDINRGSTCNANETTANFLTKYYGY